MNGQRDQLLAFQHISELITTSLDLKETLDTIVRVTARLVGTAKASIALRERDSDYLIIDPQMGHVGSSDAFVRAFRLHVDEGVGGWVMRTQQPYVVRDSDAEPLFRSTLARADGVRAWICAPLVSKGVSIGLLYALNDEPTDFRDEQVQLMVVLANHAAIAIENARLFAETQQRLHESNALFRVAQGLAENLSLDPLLQLVVDEVTRVVPNADKAVIHLLTGDRLEPRALSKREQDPRPSSAMHAGFGIAGRVLQHKQTQYVPDTLADPDFVERGTGLRSLLVAPLSIGANVIGTLSVDSHERHAFGESSRQLLSLLASQAAVAIDKARLFEETLAEKRRLEAILDNMANGVMMLDRHERIVSVNRALEQMVGYAADSLVGQSLADAPPPLGALALPDTAELPAALAASELRVGAPLNKTLRVYASPLQDSLGQRLGRVLVLHDVTLESELDQLKSDFIANVSHELRTPLFSIGGFVGLLLKNQSLDEATRVEFLGIIDREAAQLTRIVNDLLDVARMDAGYTIELELASIDVHAAVREAVLQLETLARDRQVRIEIELPASLPCVRADARRVNQVLLNLLGNAIKFTPEGGRVWVSAQALDMPRAVRVTVSDSGIGIAADDLPRVFERFYQADHSVTRRASGTGLGLYIARQIVEAMGGRVEARSRLGEGSHFSFILPAAP